MPTEQLMDLMTVNFNSYKTLVIRQFVQFNAPEDDEILEQYEEQVWFKAPDLFHAQPVNQSQGRGEQFNRVFRQLLMANDDKKKLEQTLSDLGINIDMVAFTRFNNIIAYRIGLNTPESPQLILEKKRFLPLLFVYQPRTLSMENNIISVQFGDYRQLEQGWYPHEIKVNYSNQEPWTYIIQTIKANEPIEVSPLYSLTSGFPDRNASVEKNDVDKQRLKKFIKKFEEKYQ